MYRPTERKWAGGVKLERKGLFNAVAVGPTEIWLACWSGNLYSIPKQALTGIPRERWLDEAIAPEEIGSRLRQFTAHELGVYHFFRGNDAAAVELLASDHPEQDSESLFLLAKAYARLNKPDVAQRYAGILLQDFPESLFSRQIAREHQLANIRARALERKAKQTEASSTAQSSNGAAVMRSVSDWKALFADFDADADAALGASELELALELEPERFRFQRLADPSGDPQVVAERIRRQFDRNRDGLLHVQELTDGAGMAGLPGNARPFPRTNTLSQPRRVAPNKSQ